MTLRRNAAYLIVLEIGVGSFVEEHPDDVAVATGAGVMQGGNSPTPLPTTVVNVRSVIDQRLNDVRKAVIGCFVQRGPATEVSNIRWMVLPPKESVVKINSEFDRTFCRRLQTCFKFPLMQAVWSRVSPFSLRWMREGARNKKYSIPQISATHGNLETPATP